MKSKWISVLLILMYCVPWIYLALWGDGMHGTMLLYALMLAAHAGLCVLCVKRKCAWAAVAGSAVSGAVSLVCVLCSPLTEMNYYFKPFTAVQLAAAVSVLLFAAQAGAAVWQIKKGK